MKTIKNIVAVLSLASLLLLLCEFRIAFIGLIIFTGLWLFLDSYEKIDKEEINGRDIENIDEASWRGKEI